MMLRAVLLVFGLCMVAVAPSAAGAAGPSPSVASTEPSAFETWRDLCSAHRADFNDAVAAADRAGWLTPPDAMMQRFAITPSMGKPTVRLHMSSQGMQALIVGVSPVTPDASPGLRVPMRYCGVGFQPSDPRLNADVAAFAAVPRNPVLGPDFTGYVYRDVDGRREPILSPIDTPAAAPLVRSGQLSVILIKSAESSDLSLVLFGVPTS